MRLRVNAAPVPSQPQTSRSPRTATLTRGGSNEHCITQEASIPVSRAPSVAVRMNSPLGTRPSTGASACMECSVIAASLLEKVRHGLFDQAVFVIQVLPLLQFAL